MAIKDRWDDQKREIEWIDLLGSKKGKHRFDIYYQDGTSRETDWIDDDSDEGSQYLQIIADEEDDDPEAASVKDKELEKSSGIRNAMRCPDCGKPISSNAEACPYCGRSFRSQKSGGGTSGFAVFVAIVLAVIFLIWLLPKIFTFEIVLTPITTK